MNLKLVQTVSNFKYQEPTTGLTYLLWPTLQRYPSGKCRLIECRMYSKNAVNLGTWDRINMPYRLVLDIERWAKTQLHIEIPVDKPE